MLTVPFSCSAVFHIYRWHVGWKRTLIILGLGLLMTFGMEQAHFASAGAMGGLIMCMFASVCWKAGWPAALALKADEDFSHLVEHDLAVIWSLVCQPLLFGVIGVALDFRIVDASTIPKAIGLILLGLVVRLSMAYVATGGRGSTPEERLTFKERAFIALSWAPKATVQAALCSAVLDAVQSNMQGDSKVDDYERWGMQIMTTAILSILLSAPMGLAFISVLGPRWLSLDRDPLAAKKGQQEEKDEEGGELGGGALSSGDKQSPVSLQHLEVTMHDKHGEGANGQHDTEGGPTGRTTEEEPTTAA